MEELTRKECKNKLEMIRKERGLGSKNVKIEEKSSSNFNVRSQQKVQSCYSEYNKALVTPSFLYKK